MSLWLVVGYLNFFPVISVFQESVETDRNLFTSYPSFFKRICYVMYLLCTFVM